MINEMKMKLLILKYIFRDLENHLVKKKRKNRHGVCPKPKKPKAQNNHQ
jgi:hypothetical protein